MTFDPMKEARDIVENYEFQLQHPKEDRLGELRENIAQALAKAYAEGVEVERERCAKVAESGYLHGTDAKNDDYACSTCGGDIRAACCIWAFNYNGNKEIAQAIRKGVKK